MGKKTEKKMKTDGNEIVLKMDMEDMSKVVNDYMRGLKQLDHDAANIRGIADHIKELSGKLIERQITGNDAIAANHDEKMNDIHGYLFLLCETAKKMMKDMDELMGRD